MTLFSGNISYNKNQSSLGNHIVRVILGLYSALNSKGTTKMVKTTRRECGIKSIAIFRFAYW